MLYPRIGALSMPFFLLSNLQAASSPSIARKSQDIVTYVTEYIGLHRMKFICMA